MRTIGLITAMTAMVVLIPAVPGLAPVQAVEILAPQNCGTMGLVRLAQYGVGDDPSDLATCEQTCRSRFGVDPYSDTGAEPQWFRGRGGTGLYYAYAQCIADCNTVFWKDFDRKARDLERSR